MALITQAHQSSSSSILVVCVLLFHHRLIYRLNTSDTGANDVIVSFCCHPNQSENPIGSTMGKAQSRLPQEAMEKALKYFEAHEVSEIIEIFNRLQADKNNNNADSNGEASKTGESGSTHAGIDIETFGEYFSYPGVLRNQIFKVFDTNGDGLIDREEFMRGLAMCCRGELNDKLKFCFSMFDLSGDGYIDRAELHRCLASTAFASFALLQAVAMEQGLVVEVSALIPAEFEKEVNAMVDDAFKNRTSMKMASYHTTNSNVGFVIRQK